MNKPKQSLNNPASLASDPGRIESEQVAGINQNQWPNTPEYTVNMVLFGGSAIRLCVKDGCVDGQHSDRRQFPRWNLPKVVWKAYFLVDAQLIDRSPKKIFGFTILCELPRCAGINIHEKCHFG